MYYHFTPVGGSRHLHILLYSNYHNVEKLIFSIVAFSYISEVLDVLFKSELNLCFIL